MTRFAPPPANVRAVFGCVCKYEEIIKIRFCPGVASSAEFEAKAGEAFVLLLLLHDDE